MELKQGYKQTELGLIPEDWVVYQLANVVNNISSGSSNTSNENGSYLLYGSTGEIGKKSYYDYYGKRILVARVGANAGNLYRVSGNYCVSDNTLMLSIKNEFILDYIFYYLSNFNLNKLVFGSGQPLITGGQLKSLHIPLPPRPEQKAIAQVLSDTDNLIQAIVQKLTKKRAIKQGAMQQLLTPKEDWEVKKLGDIARYRRGSFPQPYGLPQWYDENNGTPFVQVYDVDKNMRLKSTTKQKISDLAKDKSVFVEKGNVVITLQGSIGRIAITQYDAYVDRTLLIFTDYKVPMDNVFFAFAIQEKFRIEKENAPGGIIKTITKEELSKFDIPLPKSKKEQTEIATILSDMDAEITQIEQKLSKYKLLKQGLMQQLLTGKIRLV